MDPVWPAIGAVIAAIIGAAISFLVTVLAKEQKTSEFRQAWIDALRNDLSEFVATVDAIFSFLRVKAGRKETPEQVAAFLEEKYPDVQRMGVSYHRIMLRLNPREHTKMIAKLESVKRGELVFVLTKYVSLGLFVCALAFAVAIARHYIIIKFGI